MNDVLILLVIFCAAGIFARFGHASLFVRFLLAPTFGTLGILLSKNGLGILRPPTLLAMDLFTQVSITWLAFLLGLRRLLYSNVRSTKVSTGVLPIVFTFLVAFLLVITVLWFFHLQIFMPGLLGLVTISIFLASLLIGRKPLFFNSITINSFHAAIIAFLGSIPFLWLLQVQKFGTFVAASLPLLLGLCSVFMCTLIQWLIFRAEKISLKMLVLSLMSICSILSGLAIWFLVPHVLIAFIFGILISFFKDLSPYLHKLFMSEQSMRIVLMILIGAHLHASFEIILCGLSLGILIYLVRVMAHLVMKRFFNKKAFFSSFMGSSEIAVMFLGSFLFVTPDHRAFLNDFLLLVLVASSLGDIFGVVRWSIILRLRKNKANSMPLVQEH